MSGFEPWLMLFNMNENNRQNKLRKFWQFILQINQEKLRDRKRDFFVDFNDTYIGKTPFNFGLGRKQFKFC